MDCLNLENALRHLTQEHDELKNLFQREQEQCRLKDELYKEQRKQNEDIIMQSQKVYWFICIVYRAECFRPNKTHAASVLNGFKNEPFNEFIGEVILKINLIWEVKNQREIYQEQRACPYHI